MNTEIKKLLDQKYNEFNNQSFIQTDPIQIPHRFSQKENIEISAFLTSIIAWGNRKMIINNANKMMNILDNNPIDFIQNASQKEIENLPDFKHRTFNEIDFKFFIKSLQNIYKNHGGLENVFTKGYQKNNTVKNSMIHFREIFFSIPFPERTTKHIANVAKNSAAKRINMFLMWLVRNDNRGVHFGLWKNIPTSALMLPIDVHSGNTARRLGLLTRNANDWKAVEEISEQLRNFDPKDPIKYDFALFGLDI